MEALALASYVVKARNRDDEGRRRSLDPQVVLSSIAVIAATAAFGVVLDLITR